MKAHTFIFWAAFFLIVPIGGCQLDSAERVALVEQQVVALQQRSAEVDTVIDGLERFLATIEGKLADPNLPSDTVARLADAATDAQTELARVRDIKCQVDAVLASWQQQLADAGPATGPGNELQLLGQGVSTVATHLPTPWSGYAALAGGLITAVGGVVVGLRRAEAEKENTATVKKDLTNVIHSVDSLLDSPQITDEAAAKALLADRQGTATATTVKAIKNG